MNEGAWDPQARLADMDAMGVDQALLYPTWFAEGFFLVRDPDVAYALARAYNDWIAGFLQGGAAAAVRRRDIAAAEHGFRARGDYSGWRGCRASAPSSSGRCSSKTAISTIPITIRCGPNWSSSGSPRRCTRRRACGTRNGPRTGRSSRRSRTGLAQPPVPGGGGGPFAGGSGGAGQSTTFIGATPLGHPLAPILAPWLDNHMFVASTLIGFTVMERYPAMKVVVAHGKASWMQEVLEKMEASTRVIPLLHHYPVSTEPEEMWEHGNVMLGFDAEERLIQKLPQDFAHKIVWGSRYPQHDATSAWDAIARLRAANVPEPLIARMMGGNAAQQFAIEQLRKSTA